MGLFSKIKKAFKFAFSHIGKVIKGGFKNPLRLLTGVDPLGTKIGNAIFGTKYKPLTNVFGGATEEQFASYEAKHGAGSLGFAKAFQAVADTIAGFYAGGALTKLGGQAVAGLTGKGVNAATNAAAQQATAAAAAPAASGAVTAAAPVAGAATTGGAAAAGGTAAATAAPAQGFLGKAFGAVKNFATSEAGMNIIGGALQGYAADRQQQRAIDEQRRYTRPFTSAEVESITRDVAIPGGYLERARNVGRFLNNNQSAVTGPGMTPEEVAALARGG